MWAVGTGGAGGEHSATQELAVRGGGPTDDASTVEDIWEIRGDRVVRVINIPRCHTTVPSLEPEPCPIADDKLTCKRVTIVKFDDPNDWRTIVDAWKSPDTGELVESRRQKMNLSQRPWKGEIIFEMNQEEKERRNLHRTMDIEAEQVLADNDPEPTQAPDQSPDEQIQVLKPRTRRQQEAIVTRDGGAQAEN